MPKWKDLDQMLAHYAGVLEGAVVPRGFGVAVRTRNINAARIVSDIMKVRDVSNTDPFYDAVQERSLEAIEVALEDVVLKLQKGSYYGLGILTDYDFVGEWRYGEWLFVIASTKKYLDMHYTVGVWKA